MGDASVWGSADGELIWVKRTDAKSRASIMEVRKINKFADYSFSHGDTGISDLCSKSMIKTGVLCFFGHRRARAI